MPRRKKSEVTFCERDRRVCDAECRRAARTERIRNEALLRGARIA